MKLLPRALTAALLGAALLAGCATDGDDDADDTVVVDPTDTPDEAPDGAATPLGPRELLVRASIDLRGVRPSLAELDAVDADPTAVDALIDGFLDDPRFPVQVRVMFDEVLRIRDEKPFVELSSFRELYTDGQLAMATGEEATRILERIVADDLSLREWVTGDWTVVNEVAARMYPVDYPEGATGWQLAHYTDDRPVAGALSTNGIWWQHGSMLNNLNRGRANQASRIFLCRDYLATDIDFTGIAALDSEAALGSAIRNDPACAACHDTLDPLASHFFGFWYYSERKFDPLSIRDYHPERELEWRALGGLPPALHGEPTYGLEDFGARVADDPDFARCFTRRSWEGVLRHDLEGAELAELPARTAAFVETDLNVRALFRELVRSDAYRDGSSAHGRRVVSAGALSSQIEDLTGFSWSERGWDLMRAPIDGFGPLAGNVDGFYRTIRLETPAATLALVHKRLAEPAAAYVVEHDLVTAPGEARLLVGINAADVPDDAALRQQLAQLHRRVLSEDLPDDAPELDLDLQLWRDAYALASSPVDAWRAVVTLLLRDPRMLVY